MVPTVRTQSHHSRLEQNTQTAVGLARFVWINTTQQDTLWGRVFRCFIYCLDSGWQRHWTRAARGRRSEKKQSDWRRFRFRARLDQWDTHCRHPQALAARGLVPVTRVRGRSVSIRVGRVCCGLSVRGLILCLALSTMTRKHTGMNLSMSTTVHRDLWSVSVHSWTFDGSSHYLTPSREGFEPHSHRSLRSRCSRLRRSPTWRVAPRTAGRCWSAKTPGEGFEPRSLRSRLHRSHVVTRGVTLCSLIRIPLRNRFTDQQWPRRDKTRRLWVLIR